MGEKQKLMRILSYLNLSNPSNLEADSGFVFQRTLLRELAARHQVYLIGPPGMPELDPAVSPLCVQFPATKFGVRFGFAYESLRKALSALPACDILISNQTELTTALLALCYEVWGRRIKCVSYFHYLALQQVNSGVPVYDPSLNAENLGAVVWQRQQEAFRHSEINIIGSRFGSRLLADGLADDFDASKVCVIPPPATLEGGLARVTGCLDKKPLVIYNHRLYAHYGGVQIFEMLARINDERPFRLIVTDPTFQRSEERDKLDNSVQHIRAYLRSLLFVRIVHCQGQPEYRELLSSADFALGPMRTGALWSMAIVDVMSMGKPVIAFDDGGFGEVVQDADLLVSDETSFRKTFLRLLTDEDYRKLKGEAAREIAGQYDAALIAGKFELVFKQISGGK